MLTRSRKFGLRQSTLEINSSPRRLSSRHLPLFFGIAVLGSILLSLFSLSCGRVPGGELVLQLEGVAGSMVKLSGNDYTLTINQASSFSNDGALSNSDVDAAWSQVLSKNAGSLPQATLRFKDSTLKDWLFTLQMNRPNYQAGSDTLEMKVLVSHKEAVSAENNNLGTSRVSQSDTPDTLLALLTALR